MSHMILLYKFQSVTGTDNEFTECQTPKKSFNQLAFHLSAYTHFENFKEQYFRSIQSAS